MSQKSHTNGKGWDGVSNWYNGWVGKGGSFIHQEIAIPELISLSQLERNEALLDVGCGQGVLAPYIRKLGVEYTGVDLSPEMIRLAKKHHGGTGKFIVGDARRLEKIQQIAGKTFDVAIFLLSIQDMDPLDQIFRSVVPFLSDAGRIVVLMTHPAFRIPRQSGWGIDQNRKLKFRRVDNYLTSLRVPMKAYENSKSGKTISFHRPISAYVNALGKLNFGITAFHEIPEPLNRHKKVSRMDKRSMNEIPMFLAIKAERTV